MICAWFLFTTNSGWGLIQVSWISAWSYATDTGGVEFGVYETTDFATVQFHMYFYRCVVLQNLETPTFAVALLRTLTK
jgi:hypothetical protein